MSDMGRPIIVAGCGRSGTHWLGNIMAQILGPEAGAFEPNDPDRITDVVVDSRLRHRIKDFDGRRIVHLVRDGRDVVRSLDNWQKRAGTQFQRTCEEWAEAVWYWSQYVMRL